MKKYIAYYRVSTTKQGTSGLGIEAQKTAVADFIKNTGELVGEYTEIESGKKNNRVVLHKAIAEAKEAGATLVIAKLDRLSRNVAFIFSLRDSKVDFVAADVPDMNSLTVGVIAVVAQYERELISKRTKSALAAKKAKGGTLGNAANFSTETRKLGVPAIKENARTNDANVKAAFTIKLMMQQPQKPTLREIAAELNKRGFKTRRGKPFTSVQVMRLAKLDIDEKPVAAEAVAAAEAVEAPKYPTDLFKELTDTKRNRTAVVLQRVLQAESWHIAGYDLVLDSVASNEIDVKAYNTLLRCTSNDDVASELERILYPRRWYKKHGELQVTQEQIDAVFG